MHLPSKKERNLIFRSNVDRRIMGNVDLLYDLMTEDRVRLPVLLTLDCVPLNRICAGGPSVSFLRVFGISSIHWFYFSSVPLIPFGLSIRSTTRCYITSTLDTVLQKNQRNKQRNLRWSPLSVSTHLCDKSHFLKPWSGRDGCPGASVTCKIVSSGAQTCGSPSHTVMIVTTRQSCNYVRCLSVWLECRKARCSIVCTRNQDDKLLYMNETALQIPVYKRRRGASCQVRAGRFNRQWFVIAGTSSRRHFYRMIQHFSNPWLSLVLFLRWKGSDRDLF